MQSESSLQVPGQVVLAPSHTKGLQLGEPTAPAGDVVQAPSADAPSSARQVSQAPEQAVLQQTPSTQLPLEH
jgi:hypothetical protein